MAYTPQEIETIFNQICLEITLDGVSLRNVLKGEGMPDAVTFYKWLDEDDNKIKQYAGACARRADSIFEDIMIIADDQENDIIEVDGKEITNHNVINRSRLRVDSRKWILSKMNPKKYGDKVDLTSGGKKISNPIYQVREVIVDKSDET